VATVLAFGLNCRGFALSSFSSGRGPPIVVAQVTPLAYSWHPMVAFDTETPVFAAAFGTSWIVRQFSSCDYPTGGTVDGSFAVSR
jgi:hypothetical protein